MTANGTVFDENNEESSYIEAEECDIPSDNCCRIAVNYLTNDQLGKWRCDMESTGLTVDSQVRKY